MTTYNTYQEAKVANPEYAVFEYQGNFGTDNEILDMFDIQSREMKECKPADHCMTVEKFLADGYKFSDGDALFDCNGEVRVVGGYYTEKGANKPHYDDDNRYVLRAAALDKPKRVRASYVKLDEGNFNVWDLKGLLSGGELFSKTSDGRYVLYSENSPSYMLRHFSDYGVYRRIETEIDERQEFIERAEELIDISKIAEYSLGKMYDAGCRFSD